MFTPDPTTVSPEFKRAAIDWVLTHGTCESMTESTSLALARLTVMGVDYDASDMPTFTTVTLDAGDTDNGATYGEAFACRVLPLGSDKDNWRAGHEFWVGKDDLMQVLMSNMIMGLISAAETGDAGWKARASTSEIARLERHREADAERARLSERKE